MPWIRSNTPRWRSSRNSGRDSVTALLLKTIQSHYDDVDRIAADVAGMGYEKAAAILSERMPRRPRARSGEIGEILATEIVEEKLGYRVPFRRLRYKDGREMALRGDDIIGIASTPDGLSFAKGESKSRANLTKTTITEARAVLSRDSGRPTPTSILFVVDRLMDRGGTDEQLGRAIRDSFANQSVPARRVAHVMFTMSGNSAPQALADDLTTASENRHHVSIHLHIPDHQDFIKKSYEEALKLGEH